MRVFFYFQTAKAVLASIVTTELICDNSRWRTCKVRAHMVTVNWRHLIIGLQWISPSNCNVDFIQAAVYLQPKLTFSTVAAVLCPEGPWRLFKFAISLNIAWILQWSSLVRTLHHSMFYSFHGLRWSQKTSLLQMYGSKLQLQAVLHYSANAEAMDLNSVEAIFFGRNLQCLNCDYNMQPWSNLH